ncbi:MAG: phosphatase PAP2 family protein [Xanthobacteraceae bacterium]
MNMPAVSHAAVERATWLICVVATLFAGFLLWRFQIAVEHRSLIAALALLLAPAGIYIVYGSWRPEPVLRNIGGALLAVIWSGAAAGIISLIGLRYKAPLIDTQLAELDRAVGLNVASFVEWSAAHPFWPQLFSTAYDSSFVILCALVIFLSVSHRFDKLWQLALVFAITIVTSTAISVVWPAKGAFTYFDYSTDILNRLPTGSGLYHLPKFNYFRDDPAPVLSFASLQGVVTFPSFHCCLALMTIFATRGIRWLFPASLVWNLLVIISTIPIGGHYVIDLLAGALVWLAATIIAVRLTATKTASWPTVENISPVRRVSV